MIMFRTPNQLVQKPVQQLDASNRTPFAHNLLKLRRTPFWRNERGEIGFDGRTPKETPVEAKTPGDAKWADAEHSKTAAQEQAPEKTISCSSFTKATSTSSEIQAAVLGGAVCCALAGFVTMSVSFAIVGFVAGWWLGPRVLIADTYSP